MVNINNTHSCLLSKTDDSVYPYFPVQQIIFAKAVLFQGTGPRIDLMLIHMVLIFLNFFGYSPSVDLAYDTSGKLSA